MRILDENNLEVKEPDLELGRLAPDRVVVQYHPAVEEVPEQWHYDYQVYANGGRDAIRVVDVPGVAAQEAWEEYEEIQRYILYTEEELEAIEREKNAPTVAQLLARVEELEEALDMMLTGVTE